MLLPSLQFTQAIYRCIGRSNGQSEWGGEGLALGSYLEEAVLSVVIDLDRKMAFLIGRIQNVKVGKLVAPSGQQRR